MSGSEDGPRPTPAMMPRCRPVIPPAQRPPARSTYLVAADVPRRGLVDAVVWPDTGVLLGLGTDRALLDRFRRHYRGRIRITKIVARELRIRSELPTDGVPDDEYDRIAAATTVVQALLVGPRSLQPVESGLEDLPAVEKVTQQLRALSEVPGKRHGGEAEIIVLSSKQARLGSRKHVLLSNDGGASVIAGRYGISARHIGDTLAEFACADPGLKPEACFHAFEVAVRVSAPPANCRPSGTQDFTCAMNSSGCAICDPVDRVSMAFGKSG